MISCFRQPACGTTRFTHIMLDREKTVALRRFAERHFDAIEGYLEKRENKTTNRQSYISFINDIRNFRTIFLNNFVYILNSFKRHIITLPLQIGNVCNLLMTCPVI